MALYQAGDAHGRVRASAWSLVRPATIAVGVVHIGGGTAGLPAVA